MDARWFTPWSRGERITAERLNEMVDATRAAAVDAGPGLRVTDVGGRALLERDGLPSPGGAAVTWFQVVTIEDEYLSCVAWWPGEGAAGTAVFSVAKPRELRPTTYLGKTITFQDGQAVSYVYSNGYTRTATDDEGSETQVVVPGWYVGQVIRAFRGVTGVLDGEGDPILFEDSNDTGRAWARKVN